MENATRWQSHAEQILEQTFDQLLNHQELLEHQVAVLERAWPKCATPRVLGMKDGATDGGIVRVDERVDWVLARYLDERREVGAVVLYRRTKGPRQPAGFSLAVLLAGNVVQSR